MSFKLYDYLNPRFLRRVLAWSTLYQISLALSTALLAQAAKHISNPLSLVYVLAGFALVAQLPNLIEIILRGVEQSGYLDVYRSYLEERLLRQAGRTQAWASRAQREVFSAAIGPDAANQLISLASAWGHVFIPAEYYPNDACSLRFDRW